MSKKIKPPFRVRWKFDDGDMSLSDEEVQGQVRKQHEAMAESGDPTLRGIARRYFGRVSEALLTVAREAVDASRRNRRTGPRKKRGKAPHTELIERAFACLRRDDPYLTAGKLCDILDADGRLNMDDDDIELQPRGDSVLIRDLNSDMTATVKISSLRTYLSIAKLNDR